MDTLTTFSDRREYERAARLLDGLGIEHTVISPDPAYARVGCPAVALDPEARVAFATAAQGDIVGAGWVDFREPAASVPPDEPREFDEDVVGRIAIVVLAACIADYDRLRITAHFAGDVSEALPYVNAVHRQGSYVAGLPVFTFMDGHRMVSLFHDRVGIAKADDIVDAWACLERVRVLANDVWE